MMTTSLGIETIKVGRLLLEARSRIQLEVRKLPVRLLQLVDFKELKLPLRLPLLRNSIHRPKGSSNLPILLPRNQKNQRFQLIQLRHSLGRSHLSQTTSRRLQLSRKQVSQTQRIRMGLAGNLSKQLRISFFRASRTPSFRLQDPCLRKLGSLLGPWLLSDLTFCRSLPTLRGFGQLQGRDEPPLSRSLLEDTMRMTRALGSRLWSSNSDFLELGTSSGRRRERRREAARTSRKSWSLESTAGSLNRSSRLFWVNQPVPLSSSLP